MLTSKMEWNSSLEIIYHHVCGVWVIQCDAMCTMLIPFWGMTIKIYDNCSGCCHRCCWCRSSAWLYVQQSAGTRQYFWIEHFKIHSLNLFLDVRCSFLAWTDCNDTLHFAYLSNEYHLSDTKHQFFFFWIIIWIYGYIFSTYTHINSVFRKFFWKWQF